MKRGKNDTLASLSRLRLIQILMGVVFLYIIWLTFEIPILDIKEFDDKISPVMVSSGPFHRSPERLMGEFKKVSGLAFDERAFDRISKDEFSELLKMARDAFVVGKNLWDDIVLGKVKIELENKKENYSKLCPNSVYLSGDEFVDKGRMFVIPCGLGLGSHITVVGKPFWAHSEKYSKIGFVKDGEESVMVSQFMMELQGLKAVDGEDPPRILHFNPRLKGDWSGRPVIEQNTCYRMQWGSAWRCEGWESKADEETVDGQVKCEKWMRNDDNLSEEAKGTLWSKLKRLMGRSKKVPFSWPFPFAEDKLFVLTLHAGLEGFHVNVDGRHITSFPYRIGFTLEDATGLSVQGDIGVHSIFAASLPTTHPSFAPQKHLEMLPKWQAPPLPDTPVEIFIGILSAGNHFAERMAVRKSWMQHESIKLANTVARFFVALHGRKEVNLELIKEADFFGDIVIVPYMDNYDLVVLKTVAICEYGVRTVAAKYIMKCDDDTFVRIDAVIEEAKKVWNGGSLYVGNINYFHKPLRHGKWAVTYEEWPEEVYPPYANGPGYVISSDIGHYIVSQFEKHELRLFKMEDVSMGMWVGKFNSSRAVKYIHSLNFCQFGCFEGYYTAHYQSPRQMICLWKKLQLGKPQCCNMR